MTADASFVTDHLDGLSHEAYMLRALSAFQRGEAAEGHSEVQGASLTGEAPKTVDEAVLTADVLEMAHFHTVPARKQLTRALSLPTRPVGVGSGGSGSGSGASLGGASWRLHHRLALLRRTEAAQELDTSNVSDDLYDGWTISADQYRRNTSTEVLFVSLSHLSDAILAEDTESMDLSVGVTVGDVVVDIARLLRSQLEAEPLQWRILLKEPTDIMVKLEQRLERWAAEAAEDGGSSNGSNNGEVAAAEVTDGSHRTRTARAMLGVLYAQRARLTLLMGGRDFKTAEGGPAMGVLGEGSEGGSGKGSMASGGDGCFFEKLAMQDLDKAEESLKAARRKLPTDSEAVHPLLGEGVLQHIAQLYLQRATCICREIDATIPEGGDSASNDEASIGGGVGLEQQTEQLELERQRQREEEEMKKKAAQKNKQKQKGRKKGTAAKDGDNNGDEEKKEPPTRYARAKVELEKAVLSGRASAETHALLGDLWRREGDGERALVSDKLCLVLLES